MISLFIPNPPKPAPVQRYCFECRIPLRLDSYRGRELCDCCREMLFAIQTQWFRHWHQVWEESKRGFHAGNLEA